jgi:hypothetical protein
MTVERLFAKPSTIDFSSSLGPSNPQGAGDHFWRQSKFKAAMPLLHQSLHAAPPSELHG